jgi:hypothetical protein
MHLHLRENHHINRRQADTFFGAIDFADTLGRTPTLLVTLNFGHTTCHPALVGPAFRRLRKDRFGRWLRYHTRRLNEPMPPHDRWNFEHRNGYPHVHWAVYLPAALQKMFKKRLRKWLADVAGEILCESAIHVRDIYASHALGRYQMKGLLPQVGRRYHVRSQPQGIIYGKRCGVSRALGPAARRRYAEHVASPIEPPF